MDFREAEDRFRQLQTRVQRGEPLSEEQYQEELAKLMVQDEHGTFWSLEPGTGRWLYFDGTEWVPGTPPHVGRAPEPAPHVEPEPRAGVAAATAPIGAAASADLPAAEPENVPTYVREDMGEQAPPDKPGGIAPRPVREPVYSMGADERPWLPFAIGAVVLLLCALVLFFGVRNLPFFGAASVKATATVEPTEEPTATEVVVEVPTDTAKPTATKAAVTPTPKAVTVTASDRVRVRSGPGTTFNVLTTIDSGTTLTAIGRNADSSWIQVQLPAGSNTGWVSAEFVKVNGDVNSLPVVQAQGNTSKPTATATKKPAAKTATPKP